MVLYPSDAIENAYNGNDRNALHLGVYSSVQTLERFFSYS